MRSIHHFFIEFNWQQSISAFFVLFAVINVLGSTTFIIKLRKQIGCINAKKTIVAMGLIMISFLFVGTSVLDLFRVDLDSFAIAGGIVLLLLGLEMVLNVSIFKIDAYSEGSSVVPLAFPILAGAGTLISLLTLKAEHKDVNILCGILANLVLVYVCLKNSEWIERKLGILAVSVIHRVTGIVLMSIAVKLFRTHLLFTI